MDGRPVCKLMSCKLLFLAGTQWVMLRMLGHINDVLVRFGYWCNKETRVLIRAHPRTFSYGSKMDTSIDLKRRGRRTRGTLGRNHCLMWGVRCADWGSFYFCVKAESQGWKRLEYDITAGWAICRKRWQETEFERGQKSREEGFQGSTLGEHFH